MIRDAILKELELLPEEKLPEIYDLIHYFRLGLQREPMENPTLHLAGAWSDLPDADFEGFVEDVRNRRNRAFAERPSRDSNAD
mgnify:CR=1 FL=1